METQIERLEYDDGGWAEFEKKNGRHHGRWRIHFPNGKLKWERHYVNGRDHGISRMWNSRGRLIKEQHFQDSVLHGPWKEWNSKGKLTRNDVFAFGECVSDGPRRKTAGHQNRLLEPFRRRSASQSAKLVDRAIDALKLPVVMPVKRKKARDRSRVSSWLGLVTHSPRDESWPSAGGVPMISFLQIRVDELPFVPPGLKGIAFMALFGPADHPIYDGQDELVIWTAKSLRELEPLKTPRGVLRDKPRSLSWKLRAEYPNGNDLPSGLRAHLEDFKPKSALLRRRAANKTRVGGWPGWIQFTELRNFDEVVLQFDSADLSRWAPTGIPNFFIWKSKKTGEFRTFSECS